MKAERWGVYRNPKKSETCLAWGNFITMTAESVGAGASVGGVGRSGLKMIKNQLKRVQSVENL